MQQAYQMSTNRALKAKPLAVKGNVEWAESSIELERLTSRNSTECGYSYIRQSRRGRAKSGMRRFQNREGKGDRSNSFSRSRGFTSLRRRNPEQVQGVKPIIGRSRVNQAIGCTTRENGQLTVSASAARLTGDQLAP